MGPLNSTVVGLGSLAPSGVDCSCNKARLVYWLVAAHFLIVHFINLMNASTWPLLWF